MKVSRKDLEAACPKGVVKELEPMREHTTFHVGGPADFYAEPADVNETAALCALCQSAGEPFFILGNGSNLLVSDKGVHAVMISLQGAFSDISVTGNEVSAGAGALLATVSRTAAAKDLTGLEFASGIPGTVGGAVFMNAGAYGSEVKDVLTRVKVLTPSGEVTSLPAEKLDLGYRHSLVEESGYVVLEAEFSLERGDAKAIRDRLDDLSKRRREKQPLEYPSAGSTFKRPEGHFAGKLIEEAGLRGYTVGGAQVSEKHCGFVINRGGASASDIFTLCRDVQKRVYEESGVLLELEVRLLGDFS